MRGDGGEGTREGTEGPRATTDSRDGKAQCADLCSVGTAGALAAACDAMFIIGAGFFKE